MTDDYSGVRALWWEWLAARVILGLGFGIPLAVYLILTFWGSSTPQTNAPTQSAQQGDQGEQFCTEALAAAKAYGIVPNFATTAGAPQKTDTQGRYVCTASTDASKYAIAVDYVCNDLGDPHCFNLYSVTQDDGSVLYQRQD